MAFTIYRYVLTDRFGSARGELTGATGRSLQRKLNGIDTASVTVSLTDPVARYLLDPDEEHRLKVYRQEGDATPQLVFYGPVVDVETVFGPTSGSAAINAASPVWNLTHRFAFKRIESGVARPYLFTNAKRAAVAHEAVTRTATMDGPIGLVINSSVPDSGSIGVGEAFDASWRSVAELLTEMCSGQLNSGEGFDFYVVPSDSLPGAAMGTLFMTDRRGQARQSVIFETGIGTRNNAVEARQAATRAGLANVVHHVPGVYSDDDMADTQLNKLPVVSKQQSASITVRGVHEAVLRDDIEDQNYRQQLVDLHAAVRQLPKRTVTFQPAPEEQGPSVPKAVADYDVGDTIRLRVVAPNGAIAINDDLRIYSIETAVDDQAGTGQHTLTLVPEE